MKGIKQLLLICAVVVMVGCGKKEDGNTGVVNPNKPSTDSASEKLITDHIVEKAIRKSLDTQGDNPTGKLTEADLEKVTVLNLEGNQLTEVPKGLEKLTKLKYLFLDKNKLTSVKGLEKLTQIRQLILNDNQLTDVKGLEKLTKLIYLNLGGNQLTDVKGLEKLTQLTKLSFQDNQLTDVTGLEKLTQLTLLYLDGNPALTKAQIDQLQKALPKCKIYSNPKK